jgi:hypothetical protein
VCASCDACPSVTASLALYFLLSLPGKDYTDTDHVVGIGVSGGTLIQPATWQLMGKDSVDENPIQSSDGWSTYTIDIGEELSSDSSTAAKFPSTGPKTIDMLYFYNMAGADTTLALPPSSMGSLEFKALEDIIALGEVSTPQSFTVQFWAFNVGREDTEVTHLPTSTVFTLGGMIVKFVASSTGETYTSTLVVSTPSTEPLRLEMPEVI